MYTKAWGKFLPVIRIFLKKALVAPQLVKMDKIDFDKAGGGKKAGYCFTVEFRNGKVQNRQTSAIAIDLVAVLQQDEKALALLQSNEFDLELNGKCELTITNVAVNTVATGDELISEAEL